MLQVLHTAHASLAVHPVAAVPARTANKPPIEFVLSCEIYTNTVSHSGETAPKDSAPVLVEMRAIFSEHGKKIPLGRSQIEALENLPTPAGPTPDLLRGGYLVQIQHARSNALHYGWQWG